MQHGRRQPRLKSVSISSSMEPITESDQEHLHETSPRSIQGQLPNYSNPGNMVVDIAHPADISAGSDTNSEYNEKTPLLDKPKLETSKRVHIVREKLHSCHFPASLRNLLLAIGQILSMVTMMVSLPLFTDAMTKHGSDPYLAITIAMFWLPFFFFGILFFMRFAIDPKTRLVPKVSWSNILLVAFMCSLNSLGIAYSSPSNRTPPYLQSMLTTMQIPYAVLCRLLLVKKGPSKGQIVCILVLFIGIFIAIEPEIFAIDQPKGGAVGNRSTWIWPLIFALAWLPYGFAFVFIEKAQKRANTQFLVYLCYTQLFMYGFNIVLFWTDLIPGFGMAKSLEQFLDHVERGLVCFYGADKSCLEVPLRGFIFIISYCLAITFNFLMIKYAEAVYAVVVMALVTPLGTLFWVLFKPTPTFRWAPSFNLSTIFVVVGLVIMTPAVVMYTHFSAVQEAAEPPPPSVGRKRTLSRGRHSRRAPEQVSQRPVQVLTRESASSSCTSELKRSQTVPAYMNI